MRLAAVSKNTIPPRRRNSIGPRSGLSVSMISMPARARSTGRPGLRVCIHRKPALRPEAPHAMCSRSTPTTSSPMSARKNAADTPTVPAPTTATSARSRTLAIIKTSSSDTCVLRQGVKRVHARPSTYAVASPERDGVSRPQRPGPLGRHLMNNPHLPRLAERAGVGVPVRSPFGLARPLHRRLDQPRH